MNQNQRTTTINAAINNIIINEKFDATQGDSNTHFIKIIFDDSVELNNYLLLVYFKTAYPVRVYVDTYDELQKEMTVIIPSEALRINGKLRVEFALKKGDELITINKFVELNVLSTINGTFVNAQLGENVKNSIAEQLQSIQDLLNKTEDKVKEYNDNATQKTEQFDQNAQDKMNELDTISKEKEDALDTFTEEKKHEISIHTNSNIDRINERTEEAIQAIYEKTSAGIEELDTHVDTSKSKIDDYVIQKEEEIKGATYTPSVDEEGNLSWTNNKNLPNPTTKNIRGPQGPKGDSILNGIVDKKFIREIDSGYVYVDVYVDGSHSSEYISPRGPRGYTGGTVDEPQPPTSVPYGTIVEWAGGTPPEGWMYTSGGILKKEQYPHLTDILDTVTTPQRPFFSLDNNTYAISGGKVESYYQTKMRYDANRYLYLYNDFISTGNRSISWNFTDILRYVGGNIGDAYRGMSEAYYYIELPEALNLSFVSMNSLNAEGKDGYKKSAIKNVYLRIDYWEDETWKSGAELHNLTDFIPDAGEEGNYSRSTAMIKSSFKSNKFRISVDKEKSEMHYAGYELYSVGYLKFGFDKDKSQYGEFMKIPNIKDPKGKYKIIYTGMPLVTKTETDGLSMYAYNNKNEQTANVGFEDASNNHLPKYVSGITFSEPHPCKLGYLNIYDKDSDSWVHRKTHENKEGYTYDEDGELKYLPKPSNYYRWTGNSWEYEREEEINDLIKKLTELKITRQTLIELGLPFSDISSSINELTNKLKELIICQNLVKEV